MLPYIIICTVCTGEQIEIRRVVFHLWWKWQSSMFFTPIVCFFFFSPNNTCNFNWTGHTHHSQVPSQSCMQISRADADA